MKAAQIIVGLSWALFRASLLFLTILFFQFLRSNHLSLHQLFVRLWTQRSLNGRVIAAHAFVFVVIYIHYCSSLIRWLMINDFKLVDLRWVITNKLHSTGLMQCLQSGMKSDLIPIQRTTLVKTAAAKDAAKIILQPNKWWTCLTNISCEGIRW